MPRAIASGIAGMAKLALFAAIGVALVGPGSSVAQAGTTLVRSTEPALQLPVPDPWESDPANLPDLQTCRPIPGELVLEVAPSQRAGAIRRLRHDPIIAVTGQEAATLTARALPPQTLKPFLVRAIAKNQVSGSFSANVCGNLLWVSHGSVGHSIPKSTRVPLVVFLDQQPSRLVVTWSMAQ